MTYRAASLWSSINTRHTHRGNKKTLLLTSLNIPEAREGAVAALYSLFVYVNGLHLSYATVTGEGAEGEGTARRTSHVLPRTKDELFAGFVSRLPGTASTSRY